MLDLSHFVAAMLGGIISHIGYLVFFRRDQEDSQNQQEQSQNKIEALKEYIKRLDEGLLKNKELMKKSDEIIAHERLHFKIFKVTFDDLKKENQELKKKLKTKETKAADVKPERKKK